MKYVKTFESFKLNENNNYKNLKLSYDNYGEWREHLNDEDKEYLDFCAKKVEDGERDKEYFQKRISSNIDDDSWKKEEKIEEPEPIDHEKEEADLAERNWDQYWYGDGFYDIFRSLHDDDLDSFSDHIYTALEILNKTSEYTLDSFKETFDKLLTDSFSVLSASKHQHSAVVRGDVKDAIMSIANRVETNNPNIKPY